MDMLTVFPNVNTALDITEKLIAWGVRPERISVIGKLQEQTGQFMELVDDLTTLTLPEGDVLMVAGSLAGNAEMTPSHRLRGLFVDYGLPDSEMDHLAQQIKDGNYLVIVDRDAHEEVSASANMGTLWAWPEPI